MTQPPAVLVLRRGGLGDTLLMAPVLAALRRRWSQDLGAPVRLCVAGVAEFVAVLAALGLCDEALSSESLELFALAGDEERGARARQRLVRYAAIVGDDPALCGLQQPNVLVYDPRPARRDLPLPMQILGQCGLAADPGDLRQAIQRPDAGSGVALAPGSGSLAKNWPRQRWLELAAALWRSGHAVFVVVGPAEQERDDPRAWPWPCPIGFVVEAACTALAQRLSACAAFVGNDSGTSHLAALLGLPTVAVFGAGLPEVYGPLGPRVEVVVGSGAVPPDVGVGAVLQALARLGVR